MWWHGTFCKFDKYHLLKIVIWIYLQYFRQHNTVIWIEYSVWFMTMLSSIAITSRVPFVLHAYTEKHEQHTGKAQLHPTSLLRFDPLEKPQHEKCQKNKGEIELWRNVKRRKTGVSKIGGWWKMKNEGCLVVPRLCELRTPPFNSLF